MQPSTSARAHDDAGLICGWCFEPGVAARGVTLAQASPELEALSSGSFLWLHFNLSHMGARRWLEQHQGLARAFREALDDDFRSTRIERDDDALVAVLNDVAYDFRYEPSEISTLWVSVERHLVITARESPLRSVDRLRRAVREGNPIGSA
ncbi:MAG TPA: CorA family divalent cation transporter, partial [Ramlibacter sp.]|nr:CorA family divalent cation transporter [Ramlibacter sp.]